jgi:hypothetical protein
MSVRTIMQKGGGVQRRLVSRQHWQKQPNACSISIDYGKLEGQVVGLLWELKTADLNPSTPDRLAIQQATAQLEAIDARLAECENALQDYGNRNAKPITQLVQAVEGLSAERKRAMANLESVRTNEYQSKAKPLEQVKGILQTIAEHPKEEQVALRLKLRTLIAALVERIDVNPCKVEGRVWADVTIRLRNGATRTVLMTDKTDRSGAREFWNFTPPPR